MSDVNIEKGMGISYSSLSDELRLGGVGQTVLVGPTATRVSVPQLNTPNIVRPSDDVSGAVTITCNTLVPASGTMYMNDTGLGASTVSGATTFAVTNALNATTLKSGPSNNAVITAGSITCRAFNATTATGIQTIPNTSATITFADGTTWAVATRALASVPSATISGAVASSTEVSAPSTSVGTVTFTSSAVTNLLTISATTLTYSAGVYGASTLNVANTLSIGTTVAVSSSLSGITTVTGVSGTWTVNGDVYASSFTVGSNSLSGTTLTCSGTISATVPSITTITAPTSSVLSLQSATSTLFSTATTMNLSGPLTFSSYANIPTLFPVGTIMALANKSAETVTPAGMWLRCDGSIRLKSDWPVLGALIDNVYGSTLSDRFVMPNLQDRTPWITDFVTPVGASGGEINHTLTTAEMPSHYHPMSSDYSTASHNHNLTSCNSWSSNITSLGSSTAKGVGFTERSENMQYYWSGNLSADNQPPVQYVGADHQHSINASGDVTGGSNVAHNNMQPFIALRFYILASQAGFS